MEIKPQHERKNNLCESPGVSKTTLESWMEQIKEVCKGYDQRD